jgi:perosamine synthetase
VHFAGHPCELEQIYNIADKYGLQVIEDAAHALGSSINGKKIGSFSGISCFSFYATKPITTGEGGCVALQDNKLAEKIRLLRFHGISRDSWKRYMKGGKWRYDIIEAGYKNNMTDVLAAIGIAQIKKIERFWKKRQSIAKKYSLALKNCPGLTTPFVKEGIKHSWHLYVCRVNKKEFGLSREQFIAVMDKAGIGTSVHYIPVHLHSYYRKNYGYNNGQFPVTERIGREVVSLPLYSKMSEIDVERVIQAIRDIKKGAKK